MSEPPHSGKVKVSNVDLGLLIELAPPEALSDLGEMSPGPDGDVWVEAVKLVPFLSSIRGADQMTEFATGAFERLEKLLTDHGYPLDIADEHLKDESP
ncbi:MAG: hypothetical protein WD473_11080 [Acidimicrobiia bacterium]